MRQDTLTMLAEGQMPARYLRNMGTIGITGQLRLLNSKVAVVGAGGLGGTVIELLTRQGVGYIKVIDGDVFAMHNLNRQLLATEKNLGENKALAAAKRIAEVNSDVIAEAVPRMLDEENAYPLLAGMDVVVDALDNLRTRFLLNRVARRLKIPLVHGAIAGFTGQVSSLMSEEDSLVKLYGHAVPPDKGIEASLGNPAATPALAAALEAQEVIKILTGVGEILTEKLFYFDTEYNVFELLTI